MQRKSQIFNIFKNLNTLIRTQFEALIKKLHSNNGGEYADEAFQVYLNREEILWEPTVIHNSQENGIIEYMIQMIIKMMMMIHLGKKKNLNKDLFFFHIK